MVLCWEQNLKEHQNLFLDSKNRGRAITRKRTHNFIDAGAVFIHFDSISVEVCLGTNMTVISDVVDLLRKSC